AELECEVEASLAHTVHRSQPDLHHGLRDWPGVLIVSAVNYLKLHREYERKPGWFPLRAKRGQEEQIDRIDRAASPPGLLSFRYIHWTELKPAPRTAGGEGSKVAAGIDSAATWTPAGSGI